MLNTILSTLNNNVGSITLIVGLITIIAIFRAPIVALRVQKKIEKINEQRQRKLDIFKTLLATRADTTSLEHVQALNMIDIEFYDNKDITECWNVYRDHLNSFPTGADKSLQDIWIQKRLDYFTDLLFCMSKYFGYEFNKVILQKGAYSPMAHGLINEQFYLIRSGLVKVLSGELAIKVEIAQDSADTKKEIKKV